MPLAELAELIRTTAAARKEDLSWLKLARFGNGRTQKSSFRHDRNLIAISGIEADYDGEQIEFAMAVDIAEKQPLAAILYTSPSHRPDCPRWRLLCPASREHPPKARPHLLGRLNGLYRGIFSRESWTLSQSYYFGAVGDGQHHQVELVQGLEIDRLDELDEVWLGPPAAGGSASSTIGDGWEAREDAELIRRVVTGEGFHCELTALAARYIGRGVAPVATAEILQGIMLSHHPDVRDERWHNRFGSISNIVSSAAQKFASDAEKRRAIARLTHRLVRCRQPSREIIEAAEAEAKRLGVAVESASAIVCRILDETLKGSLAAAPEHGNA